MRLRHFPTACLVALALATPAAAKTVYTGATLIDGTGGAARPDMAIVVDGATIVAVMPAADAARLPADTKRVDAKGLFVLPGLIDTHVHLATPPDRRMAEAVLRRQLYSGVTAVRDMADDLRSVGELAREALLAEVPAPDIYYAALMAGPSFFDDPRTAQVSQGATPGKVPWTQAITADTDMTIAVAMARGTYATAIKIYANLPADLVKKITDEAHRQGILVWAHGMVFPATPGEVVDANVDVMSHTCYLAYQALTPRPASYGAQTPIDPAPFANGNNPQMAALFGRMQAKHIILDATDRVYVEQWKRHAANPAGKTPNCPLSVAFKLTRQAYDAGVQISTGTDGETPWQDPYPALFEELEILSKQVGMPNAVIIHAATETGAKTIGHADEMGTIAPGKLANLVFVRRDPLADISNLRSVEFTVKRGRLYARRDYVPLTKGDLHAD
jgi:predicted amidohydrolase YtcJ